jgi:hypothetical protein
VCNDGGSGFTDGRPNSATVFTSVNYLSGTSKRKLTGCIPTDFSIIWEQGGMVRYSLRCLYTDEERDVAINTSDVTRVSDDTSAPFHDFSYQLDAVVISKLQSVTLSVSNIARMQYGTAFTPVDAVIAAPETTVDVEGIIASEDALQLAYGSSGATTTTSADMGDVSATLDIAVQGSSISTYNLSSVKPDTYSWNAVIEADTDTSEAYTLHVNDGVSIA